MLLEGGFSEKHQHRRDDESVISAQKDCYHLCRAEQMRWIKDELLKYRNFFHKPRDENAKSVQTCSYFSVDLDESSPDVVDELWVRLEELARKLVKDQAILK